jgi:N-acyl-phosphatidylethanolamine-hydrolysing phospholipase D
LLTGLVERDQNALTLQAAEYDHCLKRLISVNLFYKIYLLLIIIYYHTLYEEIMFIIFMLIPLIFGCFFIYKRWINLTQWNSAHWNPATKAFYHYWKPDHKIITLKALWKFLTAPKVKWPLKVIPYACPVVPTSDSLRITNIGHATFLIQACGVNIITDPVFSSHAGPFGKLGPKRIIDPAIAIDNLPPIDIAFISHNHYDHLDKFSVMRLSLNKHITFIVPLGVKKTLLKWGVTQPIIELDWWQSHQVKSLKLTATPAQHWSRRSLLDTNKTLWMGGIFESPKHSIFFAGDTGLGAHFTDIAANFPKIDVGLLPIGSYKPREMMKHQHMSPTDAIHAHKMLKTQSLIPIHYDVFPLGTEPFLAAEEELIEVAKTLDVPQSELQILKVGQFYEV